MMPVTIHTIIKPPDDPTSRAMPAETRKMPEPIIDPATSMVLSKGPRRCWKWGADGFDDGSLGFVVMLMGRLDHPRAGWMPCSGPPISGEAGGALKVAGNPLPSRLCR